jgi:L-ascorbate metabolism protein UlaG (beta-lactamase superfamily)
MAKLTFLGHAAFLLEVAQHRILFDPFLSGNPVAIAKPEDIECDFIILTHGHGDHIGDTVAIAKRTGAMVIANYEIATWADAQGLKSHPMHIGGAHTFPFGKVKLTIAHHGSALQTDTGFVYMGNPAGVLLTADGKTLYHAGDTGLFYDMKLIGEMHDIDLALLPIGDNFTMGIEDAAKAVSFLRPKTVIPMHYDTFDVIAANPQAFARLACANGTDVEILAINSTFEY